MCGVMQVHVVTLGPVAGCNNSRFDPQHLEHDKQY